MNQLHTFRELLYKNTYPGRGIMIGMTKDYETILVYFIMGRSDNSRNRVFERTEDGIRTRARDASKCTDPSLIIYNPIRTVDDLVIVSNGDQTDTIRDELLKADESELEYSELFARALAGREFEPDAPNFTPRISGIISDDWYMLSILKAQDPDGEICQRNFYQYEFEPGVCHFIHTYEHDGNPLPSFVGEPRRIACPEGSLEEIAEYCWGSLNSANIVSLFACNIISGIGSSYIINRGN